MKKKKPNNILSVEEVIEALKKTDGRLRECLSTLIDAQLGLRKEDIINIIKVRN